MVPPCGRSGGRPDRGDGSRSGADRPSRDHRLDGAKHLGPEAPGEEIQKARERGDRIVHRRLLRAGSGGERDHFHLIPTRVARLFYTAQKSELPDACPHCRGPLVEAGTAEQFQAEIPRQPLIRLFTVHIGHCGDCGGRTQGRHPLQTSDALGAAASPIGPDAQAAVALLHTQAGLSHGEVAAVFDAVFGIALTRGAGAQINGRVGTRLEPEYQQIRASIRVSKQLAVDETGWRVGGRSAWLPVWVGDRATAYAIDSQRSATVLERAIGTDGSGILSRDGFASYDRFEQAIHPSCLAHVLRRARELLADATRGAVAFPRQSIALFTEAIHRRNQLGDRVETDDERERQRSEFDDRGTRPAGADVRIRDVPTEDPIRARLRRPHPTRIREPDAATPRADLRALNKYPYR